jgi:hypothetical protein
MTGRILSQALVSAGRSSYGHGGLARCVRSFGLRLTAYGLRLELRWVSRGAPAFSSQPRDPRRQRSARLTVSPSLHPTATPFLAPFDYLRPNFLVSVLKVIWP